MSEPSTEPPGAGPPRRVRLVGRTLNRLIVRAPWVWPAVRGPMQRFFDRSAAGWDERTGAGSADHLAGLGAALLHVRPAPERALEVGTGTGEGALLIAREFPQARVRGVDISDRMIEAATGKVGLDPEGRIAFRVADAARLPYEAESFDLVAHLNMPPFMRRDRPGPAARRTGHRRLELGRRHPVLHARLGPGLGIRQAGNRADSGR